MKTQSWALALALALATTTVAESRPRIYFPRHVKRQFSNEGETQDSVFPPALTPAPKSEDGQNDIRLPASNENPVDGFIQGSSNDDGSSGQDLLATRSEEDSILTINVPNTVVVQSTGGPSGNGNDEKGLKGGNSGPDPQSLPTPPPASESPNDSGKDSSDGADTKKSPNDDKGAVTIAPTGVVSDVTGVVSDVTGAVSEDPEDSSKKSKENQDTSGSGADQEPTDATPTDNPTSDADKSKGNGPDTTNKPLIDLPSTDLPIVGDVTTKDPTDSVAKGKGDTPDPTSEEPADETPAPADDEPTDKDDDSLGGIIGGILDPTDKDNKTKDENDDDSNDDGLGGIVGGILSPGKNTTKTPDTTDPTKPDGTNDTDGSQQSSTKPDESDDEDEEPSSEVTLPPILPVPKPSDIPLPPLPPVLNDTNPASNGTGGKGDGTVTLPPIDLPTNEPDDDGPSGPAGPGGDTTQPPAGQPTGGNSTPGGEVTIPPTITHPGTDVTPTPPPVLGGGDGDESSNGPKPTEAVGNSTNASGGQGEATQAPNAGPNVVEPGTPVTSIAVLSTVTGTPAWLGTELVADQTASAQQQAVAAPAPTQSTEALPAGMPKTIEATEEDNPVQPKDAQLIRIVFDRRLHYEFVADNFTAAQQIFTFLPKIISFGENVDASKIQMMRLAPINSKNNGWFPTGAYLYVPQSVIAPLSADIHLPNSLLYHHEYPVAFQLASAIDPSFGIMPGSENEGESDQTGPGGAPFSNSEEKPEEQTPQQQGATAGIAMGAVTVAVAYGAAMFIVARRYKRKKQAHRRASSITNTSDMRYSPSGSPAMMGGALLSREFSGYGGVGGVPGGRESHGSGRSGAGNSGRTAYISAPVAAENSLGWN